MTQCMRTFLWGHSLNSRLLWVITNPFWPSSNIHNLHWNKRRFMSATWIGHLLSWGYLSKLPRIQCTQVFLDMKRNRVQHQILCLEDCTEPSDWFRSGILNILPWPGQSGGAFAVLPGSVPSFQQQIRLLSWRANTPGLVCPRSDMIVTW